MLKPVPLTVLEGYEMIPQAIISRPTSYFAVRHSIPFSHEHDDLDEYEVAAVQIGDGLVFAMKHYQGYPENTTTIYLPDRIKRVTEISYVIEAISRELGISRDLIMWQRSDDPDL